MKLLALVAILLGEECPQKKQALAEASAREGSSTFVVGRNIVGFRMLACNRPQDFDIRPPGSWFLMGGCALPPTGCSVPTSGISTDA
jgi:hypothetical protein